MSVIKGVCSRDLIICLYIYNGIIFHISFCISTEVYLSVFFFSHSKNIHASTSLCNFKIYMLGSSPSPWIGSACLARNVILDINLRKHCLLYSFSFASCDDKVSPMSLQEAGIATVFITASLWHLLFSWLLNLILASFKFLYPVEIHVVSRLLQLSSFFDNML